MYKYDTPVTNRELVEFLKQQPPDQLVWTNGTSNYIYIGYDEILDSVDGKTELEFLYDGRFKNYESPFSREGNNEDPF